MSFMRSSTVTAFFRTGAFGAAAAFLGLGCDTAGAFLVCSGLDPTETSVESGSEEIVLSSGWEEFSEEVSGTFCCTLTEFGVSGLAGSLVIGISAGDAAEGIDDCPSRNQAMTATTKRIPAAAAIAGNPNREAGFAESNIARSTSFVTAEVCGRRGSETAAAPTFGSSGLFRA